MSHQSSFARALVLCSALAIFVLACDFSFSLGNASPTETVAPTTRAQAPTTTPRALSPTSTRAAASSSPTVAMQPSPAADGGIITAAVLARDSSAILNSPIGVTDSFAPKQPKIHIIITVNNAPNGTGVKAALTAVEVGNAIPANTKLGEPSSSVSGSQNVDFFFESPAQGFPQGTYKVEILLNNKLDRTLNFMVKDGVPIPTPVPTKAVGSCPPPPRPNYRPPLVATKITMAEDVKGTELEPVNATRFFKTSSVFHSVVTLANAPSNTRVKAVWFAQDIGNAEPCNARLTEYELTASGSHNVDFTYRPPSKWPVGIYRVEIYVNDNPNIDVDFRVQ